jgi:hypothetical protein
LQVSCSLNNLQCREHIEEHQVLGGTAAERYQIPIGTIKNKLKSAHNQPRGRPKIFNKEEERAFTENIVALSDSGFPIDKTDLKMVIKLYLDSQGRQEKQFKAGNIPCWYFLFNFRRILHVGSRFVTT